jgi:hypothetical protein
MGLQWVTQQIADLLSKKFFGQLVISIEHGNIVNVKEVKNIKPPKHKG